MKPLSCDRSCTVKVEREKAWIAGRLTRVGLGAQLRAARAVGARRAGPAAVGARPAGGAHAAARRRVARRVVEARAALRAVLAVQPLRALGLAVHACHTLLA